MLYRALACGKGPFKTKVKGYPLAKENKCCNYSEEILSNM
jgi:hypothetical protein